MHDSTFHLAYPAMHTAIISQSITQYNEWILPCRAPWTLAVCVVLLPALRQLLGSQREEK